MKSFLFALIITVTMGTSAGPAPAEVINGRNWADDVVAYSANIQNYGATKMTDSTTWWLTGPPDCDVNGNGYAWDWDSGDLDYVAGWRGGASDQLVIVCFDTGLGDGLGDDLSICMYGGSNASAKVSASTDGGDYVHIGTLGGGAAGYLRNESFDLDGLWDVHYVKVERVTTGSDSGMFFDAFGSVPEPGGSILLVIGAAWLALGRRRFPEQAARRGGFR